MRAEKERREKMGVFVNPGNEAFAVALNSEIYVDKTENFAAASREAAKAVQQEMAGYLKDKGII